jgi:hypothetical protein
VATQAKFWSHKPIPSSAAEGFAVWERVCVLHGPAVVEGLLARIVEAFIPAGGHMESVEVWCGHCWDSSIVPAPSFLEVAATPRASPTVLAAAGVPAEPFPPGYEPLASCCLCVGEPTFRVG